MGLEGDDLIHVAEDGSLSRAQSAGVRFEELVFDEAGHGFDKPEDEARWFSALESFLAKHNPAD